MKIHCCEIENAILENKTSGYIAYFPGENEFFEDEMGDYIKELGVDYNLSKDEMQLKIFRDACISEEAIKHFFGADYKALVSSI